MKIHITKVIILDSIVDSSESSTCSQEMREATTKGSKKILFPSARKEQIEKSFYFQGQNHFYAFSSGKRSKI